MIKNNNRFNYGYTIDSFTLNQLTQYSTEDWKKLGVSILNERAIDLNLDFSDSSVKTKLQEIYNIVITYNLNAQLFQSAVVQLFIEHYDKPNYAQKTFELINFIEYIQPSVYFEKVSSVLLSPPNLPYFLICYPKNGLPLGLYLANSLIRMDINGILYPFLYQTREFRKYPQFYQLMIRYIYSLDSLGLFKAFLSEIFEDLSDRQICFFVLEVIDEYSFFKNNLRLLFYWLFQENRSLKEKSSVLFTEFSTKLASWLLKKEKELSQKEYFIPSYALLSFYHDKMKINKDFFESLICAENIEEKSNFFKLLGEQNSQIKVIEEEASLFVYFPGEMFPLVVPAKFELDFLPFWKSIRTRELKVNELELPIISNKLIVRSRREAA